MTKVRPAAAARCARDLAGYRTVQFLVTRCLVSGFDGALFSCESKDALWAMYGRPPRGKGFLGASGGWSGAGMYSAFDCGSFMPLALM